MELAIYPYRFCKFDVDTGDVTEKYSAALRTNVPKGLLKRRKEKIKDADSISGLAYLISMNIMGFNLSADIIKAKPRIGIIRDCTGFEKLSMAGECDPNERHFPLSEAEYKNLMERIKELA